MKNNFFLTLSIIFLILIFKFNELSSSPISTHPQIDYYAKMGFWDRSYAQGNSSNLFNTDFRNNPNEIIPKDLERKENFKNNHSLVGRESEFILLYAGWAFKDANDESFYIPGIGMFFEPMLYTKAQIRNSFSKQEYKYNPTRVLIPSNINPIDSARSLEYGLGGLFTFKNDLENPSWTIRLGIEQIKFDQRSYEEPNDYTSTFLEIFHNKYLACFSDFDGLCRIYFKGDYRKPEFLEKQSTLPLFLTGSNIDPYSIPNIPRETFHKTVLRTNGIWGFSPQWLKSLSYKIIPIQENTIVTGLVWEGAVSGLNFKQMFSNQEHLGNDPYDNFLFVGGRLFHYTCTNNGSTYNFFLDYGRHRFLTTSRYYSKNSPGLNQAIAYSYFHNDHLDYTKIRTVETETNSEGMIRFGFEIVSSGGVRQ
ncbi:MAG: hypothetical protein IPQ05_15510 [Leptospiraceae bacterium]|nr:hypothetical protein [Leptospiraceae bacterium]MBL0265225.1 hypothetical protein [Leptospiraceae bacterium]